MIYIALRRAVRSLASLASHCRKRTKNKFNCIFLLFIFLIFVMLIFNLNVSHQLCVGRLCETIARTLMGAICPHNDTVHETWLAATYGRLLQTLHTSQPEARVMNLSWTPFLDRRMPE